MEVNLSEYMGIAVLALNGLIHHVIPVFIWVDSAQRVTVV